MKREGLVKVLKRLGLSIVERARGRNPEAIRVSQEEGVVRQKFSTHKISKAY
jgi:hypothetical protein